MKKPGGLEVQLCAARLVAQCSDRDSAGLQFADRRQSRIYE
jgi:hypothetical protein